MEVVEKSDRGQAKGHEKGLLKCIRPVDGPLPEDPDPNEGATRLAAMSVASRASCIKTPADAFGFEHFRLEPFSGLNGQHSHPSKHLPWSRTNPLSIGRDIKEYFNMGMMFKTHASLPRVYQQFVFIGLIQSRALIIQQRKREFFSTQGG